MEEDRLESNLIHDAEPVVEENLPLRQPKKRFVGRRQATENSTLGSGSSTIEDNGAIQRSLPILPQVQIHQLILFSATDSQDPKNTESGSARYT